MSKVATNRSRSQKTTIIEKMFSDNWDRKRKRLKKSIMSFADVRRAIVAYNKTQPKGRRLSVNNPANFMKDVVRGSSASAIWPRSLHKLKYTAKQTPGNGNVFEFIPYSKGQREPFPDDFRPSKDTPRYPVQSVSLPLHARKLGRRDEPWLIQTAINLRIIETHLAVASQLPVTQLTHLQMSVKLRKTEIDALFLAAIESRDGSERQAIVTCEAKGPRERILEHQIINQVLAAFEESEVDRVIPLAIRAIAGSGMYVVEFESVTRSEMENLAELRVASTALYELKPPVPGINA